jgi:nitrate reductase gamma subunit
VPGIRGAAKKAPGTRLYDAFLKIGIYGMMIGFGALFASTIVSRVAYLIGRLTDLIASPEASIVATILVIGAIAYAYRHEKKTAVGKLEQKEPRKTP